MRIDLKSFSLLLLVLMFFTLTERPVVAQSPAAAMLRLLKSGRVPEQRLPTIVKLICDRGNAEDLGFIFSEVVKENHWSENLRAQTLEELEVATRERKVVPTGDLSGIVNLMTSQQSKIRDSAVELAGLWKVSQAEPQLLKLAQNPKISNNLRRAALSSLVSIEPKKASQLLKSLASEKNSFSIRALAISVLAPLNVQEAAALAASLLQHAQPLDDLNPILAAFLDLKHGSEILAKQLQKTPPSKDVAKLLLRQMYALGRTDEELNRILSDQSGINRNAPPPTKEETVELAAEAARKGNPQRGEEVFRRKDLSCMNCHSVSKAGGQIGPDLSAVGTSLAPEYLVASVLDPDQAIKEAYVSRTVVTMEGKIYQGIIDDRTKDALILKDATGKKISIPLADIDEEFAGKSLMPKGLVNFMTHAEFLDLVAFLTQLGKPGEFTVRTTQRMQRYRLLTDAPPSILEQIPTLSNYEDLVLLANAWKPVYAKVNGELPLEPLKDDVHSDVIYVRGDVQCSESGDVVIHLNSSEGVTLWLDDQELGHQAETRTALTPGTHSIVLRIDLKIRKSPVLKIELTRPENSAAEFVVVDGK